MPELIDYRLEVQEYRHLKNGDIEKGKYTIIEGNVAREHWTDIGRIIKDIYHDLFPPVKPLRMFRSALIDPDPEVEGRRVCKRVYKIHVWTSSGLNETDEIIRKDLD